MRPSTIQFARNLGRNLGCNRRSPIEIPDEGFQRLWRRDPDRAVRRAIKENFGRHYVTTTDNIAYGTYTPMTVTSLQSLVADATDPFTSWQSARVSNIVTLADDYEIFLHLPTTADAPANDSAAYCYLVPWITTDGGSTWTAGGNFGTITLPTGSEGTAILSDPNSMKGPIALPYKVTSQIMQSFFSVGQMCGGIVPDGWSLAIRTNNCAVGASKGLTTGCVVAYRAVTWTNS